MIFALNDGSCPNKTGITFYLKSKTMSWATAPLLILVGYCMRQLAKWVLAVLLMLIIIHVCRQKMLK